jgi:hypothetical protein
VGIYIKKIVNNVKNSTLLSAKMYIVRDVLKETRDPYDASL